MPWHVAESGECPPSKPWACINDQSGEVEGCHETKEDAEAQMAALYANEGTKDTVSAPSIHIRRLEHRREYTQARLLERARRDGLSIEDLSAVKLDWYEIRDADAGPDQFAEVFLFDEIGGSFGVSAKQFVADLQQITAPTIHLRINSPGGGVWEGTTIHSALMHHPARVISYVDGLAASMASVIALAGEEIVMMPGSQFMIHDASMMEDGNPAALHAAWLWLDRQSDNIASMYADRAGGTPEEWRALMQEETWLFADEAVEIGVADRAVKHRPKRTNTEIEERMARTFPLSHFKYRGRENAPTPGSTRVTRRVRRSVTTSPRVPTSTGVGEMSSVDRAGAAQLRAEGLQRRTVAPRAQVRSAEMMPGSQSRSVPFGAPRLSVNEETRNGMTYYHVYGQASVFGVGYDMWDEFGVYTEYVDMGSGDASLRSNPDVAFLENHRGLTMARTTNGTLELAARDGLDVDAWLNPKRDDCQRLASAIDDKLITEMSFAFLIDSGWWNDDYTEFHIGAWNIHRGDVSAVNYGANPHTFIAARSREILRDLDYMSPSMARAALDRLAQRVDVRRGYVAPAVPSTVGRAPSTADTANTRQIDDSGRTLASVEALIAVWDEEDRRRALPDA